MCVYTYIIYIIFIYYAYTISDVDLKVEIIHTIYAI